jgi:hypothetical protein
VVLRRATRHRRPTAPDRGMITYLILNEQGRVDILDVLWSA